jgi:hypothetical protein
MKTPLALLCAAALAAPASAVDWNNLGARSVGMGGTGVAVPQGPADNYWNPANLGAVDSKTGFHIPVTAHFGVTGSMIEGANDLDELSQRSQANITQAEIDAALAKIGATGNGVRADAGVGFDFKYGRWNVFLNGFGYMGATPSVDRVNNTAANIANKQNNSKLIVRGASVSEIGVGHGRELPIEGVFVGGNLKVMSAKVGYADAFILREDQEFDDLFDRMKTATKQSANIGVDLGAMWDLERSFGGSMAMRPRLGLTARNINNPGFKQSDAAVAAGYTSKFKMNPQLRFGASIQPLNWWTIATDLDMTRNLTMIDGVASRQWGLGSEFNLVNREAFNIPLRVGLLRNLADGRSGTMVTFGAGLNIAHFHADASFALSPKRVKTQSVGKSEEFPREAMLGISIGLLFGGTRDEARGSGSAPAPSGSPEPARDEQPVSSDKVRESMEKAQKELDKEAEKSR